MNTFLFPLFMVFIFFAAVFFSSLFCWLFVSNFWIYQHWKFFFWSRWESDWLRFTAQFHITHTECVFTSTAQRTDLLVVVSFCTINFSEEYNIFICFYFRFLVASFFRFSVFCPIFSTEFYYYTCTCIQLSHSAGEKCKIRFRIWS